MSAGGGVGGDGSRCTHLKKKNKNKMKSNPDEKFQIIQKRGENKDAESEFPRRPFPGSVMLRTNAVT